MWIVLAVHVLGPVEVVRDGVVLDLGGPQQRAVIAHLALDAGRVVSVERLIDRLWGEEPPRTPLGTLQSYVSRLRRAIEPAREVGSAPQVLVSEAPGYVLRVNPSDIDVHQFRAIVNEARSAAASGYAGQALERFDAALALWRGPALAGIGNDEQVRSVVVQLDEERALAIEDRFEVLLALGRHAVAVPALQVAVDEHPLRERLWALLALALYRSSRQADALRALSTARSTLLDELGLDPGPELRALEDRILAQDPSLLATPEVAAPLPTVPDRPVKAQVELIGRGDEWSALTSALQRVAAHGAQVVLIEGEPGMGKSTISDAFLATASARGWRTAVGRCVEAGLAPSLWPATEIVRDLVADLAAPDEATLANPLYRYVVNREVPSGAMSPVELADHFVDLIDSLDLGPTVVLLDDLHWADRATLDVLVLALERLGTRPVLVVGAHRPPEIVPDSLLGEALGVLARAASVTRISMSPLATDEVARLMELTTGAVPSHDIADRVQSRAAGNPLFVVELARLAGERGLSDDSSVPDAIRDVVRSRLGQLPANSTAELQVAAVLGERFELQTVMAASERDPDGCLDALDAAIVTRILVPDGPNYRFAHALVRDAVLAEITGLRMARLHLRAADALAMRFGDNPEVAEPIAHHRLAAVTVADPLTAARAAVRAADVARWRGALDAADVFSYRALEVLSGLARTPELSAIEVEALEAIAGQAHRRDDPDAVERVGADVLAFADRTGSDAARALGLFLTWGHVDETDDLSEIEHSTALARQLAERTTDRYAVVTTRYMLGSYDLLHGDIAGALEHVGIAIDAVGSPDPDVRPQHVPLVLVPVVAGMAAAVNGRADEARVHAYRRAPAWLADRAEVDPTALVALAFNRALVEALLGEPAGVLRELGNVDLIDKGGFMSQQRGASEVLLGWARAVTGDPTGAEQAVSGMATIDQGVDLVLRPAMRTFVGEALLAAGDERAVAVLAEARRGAEQRGEVWWLSETIRLQSLAEQRFGDTQRAAALRDAAIELARRQGAEVVVGRLSS